MRNMLNAFACAMTDRAHVKCLLVLAASMVLGNGLGLWAQTSNSQAPDANQSWRTTGESRDAIGTWQSVDSHTTSGNRALDSHSIAQRKPDGTYETYLETEKETVHVSSSTTRTVTRTYAGNGSGGKTLVRVTEEEMQTLPNGGSKSIRTSSDVDLNGNLQQFQREIAETRKVGVTEEETKTMVLRASANGGFAPAVQIEEHQQHAGNNTEFQKTTRTLDGAGTWQISEVRQGTIKEDRKSRTTDERVLRPDQEGRLSEISHTVSADSENGSGEEQSTVESYSIDVPGSTRDGKLHLVQRVTSKQSTSSNGQQTSVRQVEQPNPGDPSAGLRVIEIATENSRSAQSGTEATRTVRARNMNGSLDVISVDFSKSDKTAAVQVQIAPSNKPK